MLSDDGSHDVDLEQDMTRLIQEKTLEEIEKKHPNKQTDESIVKIPRKKTGGKRRGRPPFNTMILVDWIAKKGKRTWNIEDFLKDYPKFERNKNRLDKQLSNLIKEHKIIQLDNKTFRVNV